MMDDQTNIPKVASPLNYDDVEDIWQQMYDNGFFAQQMVTYQNQKEIMVVVDLEAMMRSEAESESADTIFSQAVDTITDYPKYAIKAITTVLKKSYPSIEDVSVIVQKFVDFDSIRHKIRELRSKNINQGVVFEGIVRNSTPVLSKLRSMAYSCPNCGDIMYVEQEGEEEDEDVPPECCNCNTISDLERAEDFDKFTDYIECEIEENPEGMGGKQAERITGHITGALTEERLRAISGDRAYFMGVYKVRKKGKSGLIYEKYVDIIGAEKKGKKYEEDETSDEDKVKFEEMSKSPTLLEDLSSCIAPNIYGYDKEKKAILLQLLSGNLYSERRGNIHILLVGEPGIGKSSLLETIEKIAPLVVRASGAPTTTCGLTATCIQDESKAGGFVIEAGACVLASGGLLILDELDKMDEKTRGSMHEIMENQRCTVTKANVNTQLTAECSVLAIMNPKNNRFIKDEPTNSQIDLPPSLLSRFDLIFALKDIVDESKDRKIIDSIDRARDGEEINYKYTPEEVTKYIQYARSKIKEMKKTKDARAVMADRYIKIREKNKTSEAVAITTRQYEGLSRLAEAHAKMRLSTTVEVQDAEAALQIMDYYLATMCLDPGTGELCVDSVMGGKVPSERKRDASLLEVLVEMRNIYMNDHPNTMGSNVLIDIEEAKDSFVSCGKTEKEFKKSLDSLHGDGKITLQKGGTKIKIEKEK